MPVRSNSFGMSSVACIEHLCDESLTAIGTTCEDIWNKFDDFLLTPPQSPPVKFDLVSDTLDDDFSVSVDALSVNGLIDCVNNHNADVLHDCMWSGLCNEDYSNAKSGCLSTCRNYGGKRRETTSLSASPFSLINCSFTDLYNTCNDVDSSSEGRMDDDTRRDEQEECDDLGSRVSFDVSNAFSCNNESLKNDHSYGSPESSPQSRNSLIVPLQKSKAKTRDRSTRQLRVADDLKAPPITVKFVKRHSCVAKSIGSTDSSRRCKLSQSKRSTVAANLAQKCKRGSEYAKSEPESSLLVKSTPKSSSKSMYPERRREHNDSERKRRDHLRNAFHFLRDQIPKLKDAQKKPARIVILSEATSFVNSLREKQLYLEKMKDEELKKREKLFKKLTHLQNN